MLLGYYVLIYASICGFTFSTTFALLYQGKEKSDTFGFIARENGNVFVCYLMKCHNFTIVSIDSILFILVNIDSPLSILVSFDPLLSILVSFDPLLSILVSIDPLLSIFISIDPLLLSTYVYLAFQVNYFEPMCMKN